MESAWKTQTKFWHPLALTKPLVRTKRVHSRKSPDPTTKKPKPTIGRGTVLEGWLNGPCKIHSTPDTIPTHNLRACQILRQVDKCGEDLLINNTAEHHPVETNNIVLIVFKTFASNNMRKRELRSLDEVCHVVAINPWNDTAITFNASDKPQFRTVQAPAALVLSPIVDGFRLTKVLMDGGSGLNLIYKETLNKMEIDKSRIEQSSTTFKGIIPSREARFAGKITLDVVFGTSENYRSEEITFQVAPFSSGYHAHLGRGAHSRASKLYPIMGT